MFCFSFINMKRWKYSKKFPEILWRFFKWLNIYCEGVIHHRTTGVVRGFFTRHGTPRWKYTFPFILCYKDYFWLLTQVPLHYFMQILIFPRTSGIPAACFFCKNVWFPKRKPAKFRRRNYASWLLPGIRIFSLMENLSAMISIWMASVWKTTKSNLRTERFI